MSPERWHRCPQCYHVREWPADFIGKRGRPVNFCTVCQAKYAGWMGKTTAEKLAATPAREDPLPTGRMLFTLRSQNKKTGPIPVSISERGTCPPSCSLYEAGCYASYGKLGAHWRGRGTAAGSWVSWEAFLARVRGLPKGTLWRHNEAGDLAGSAAGLDRKKLGQLVRANRGRRGFTFTHRTDKANWGALRQANLNGFTINLSADSPEEADRLLQAGEPFLGTAGPVALILPRGAQRRGMRTPAGHRVVVCPAQTAGITCAECELCANPFRRSVVGFLAHGQSAALVPEIVSRRRLKVVQ